MRGILPHLLAWCLATAVVADTAHAGETPVKRDVLLVYDSGDPYANTVDTCYGHTRLAMPLNRLGFVDQYADAKQRPLPDAAPYAAVAVWLADDRLNDPAGFLAWLTATVRNGTRVILIGPTGAEADRAGQPVDAAALKTFYATLGVQRDETVPGTDNPFAVREEVKQADGFGFETRLPPEKIPYERWVPAREDWVAWKMLTRTDVKDADSLVVGTSPRGGWVADEQFAVRIFDTPTYRVLWDLHPFRFLEEALGCRGVPRPDVTTVGGARAAFSHIDGDGQVNMTQDLPGATRPASAVVLEEILAQIPVPVTVGLIVARTDPAARGDKQYMPLWKRIMARPNVQAGCHGFAHPLNWAKGVAGVPVPGYTFSEKKETVDAMAYLREAILPPGARVEIFLWTGDCAPNESAVALVEEDGALQMNGGDPRYDALANSITFIAPLTRAVGDRRQIHAAACNEYIYTNGWTENYGGFRNVLETFKRTETPRLLPVNIYYHFYSGEKQAGLRALQDAYAWSLKQPLCWIHAAEYARAVQGFLSATIARTGDGGWRIARLGGLRTLRFDDTTAHVDLARSRRVTGYTHHAGSLYVSLAGEDALVYLAENPTPRPSLRRSTSLLRQVKPDDAAWSATARLYAPGFIELQGWPAGTKTRARVGEQTVDVQADGDGRLSIPLPAGWGTWTEVRVGH